VEHATEHTDPFDVLGVDPADLDDEVGWQLLRRAYRQRAKQTHPDRGGDEDDFRQLKAAWDALNDRNWRRLRDQALADSHDREPRTPTTAPGGGGAEPTEAAPATAVAIPTVLLRLWRALLWTQKVAVGATLLFHAALVALAVVVFVIVAIIAAPFVAVVLLLAPLSGTQSRREILAEFVSPVPVLQDVGATLLQTLPGLYLQATILLSGPVAGLLVLWLLLLGLGRLIRAIYRRVRGRGTGQAGLTAS
jgi:hypothetical protein